MLGLDTLESHLGDEFFGSKGGFEGSLESWFFTEFLGAPGIIWGPNKRKSVIYGGKIVRFLSRLPRQFI